jgi:arylsulfatase A-like enzyme
MHRPLLLTLAATLVATAAPAFAKASAGETAKKPNILFFAVDDLRPELACYGAKHIHSPNLDKLAARGTLFLDAHCQQAVCSPSRTSLMTGLRPDSTKVWDLDTHFRDHVPDVVTVSQNFIKHGYHAVSMGKIYHGGFDDKLSWSEPALKPKGAKRYVLPETIQLMAKKRKAAIAKGLKGKPLSRASRGPATECADVPDEEYSDGAIAKLAVETLGRLKEKEQPFFLAVGFLNPHLPFNSPKQYWDLYQPEKIKLAPNPFRPKNVSQYALSNWGEIRVYEDIPPKGAIPDDKARELKHGYYAAVSFIDACVGKVLDELERLDLADDTIVVLWGDHGWKLGEHACWCKHTNVRLDTRVPLIISSPKQATKGAKSKALVEFVDIYPSLCDLAGIDKPGHLEGTSFAPLLAKPDRKWKRAAFSQYPRSKAMGYSLTADGFRYTVWVERKQPKNILARELYDHSKDPRENENVIDNPEHKEVVQKLHAYYLKGWQGTRKALTEK